jgi:F0F1-type ATP synthase assembly protein I
LSKQQKQQTHKTNGKNGDPGDRARSYMKYAGMAFQMGAMILAGALLGRYLDGYYETQRPYLTVVCSLFAIFAALYLTLKDLFNE